jgi:hypothetical protein
LLSLTDPRVEPGGIGMRRADHPSAGATDVAQIARAAKKGLGKVEIPESSSK